MYSYLKNLVYSKYKIMYNVDSDSLKASFLHDKPAKQVTPHWSLSRISLQDMHLRYAVYGPAHPTLLSERQSLIQFESCK